MSTDASSPPGPVERAKPRRSLVVVLPLLIFGALATVFLAQLLSGRDISTVPSALIGQPAPESSRAGA